MVDKDTLKKYLTKKHILIGLAILGGVILVLGLAIGIPMASNLKKAHKLLDKYILIDGCVPEQFYYIIIFLFY